MKKQLSFETVPVRKPKSTARALTLPALPILTREPAYDEWVAFGRDLKSFELQLEQTGDNYRFAVAKWYEYGVDHWKRPAEKIAKEIGYDPDTIKNWAWVERHTAQLRESPRGDNSALSFEHYKVLAAVKSADKQAKLVEQVQSEGLSARQLNQRIQNSKRAPVVTEIDMLGMESPIEKLIEALCAEGAALMEKPDEISRAQADVKLDCAARLREVAG